MLLSSSNRKYQLYPLSYFSVVVCLRCLLHHILLLIAYTFRENWDFVFIIIVQFMMSANIRIRFGLQIVFVYNVKHIDKVDKSYIDHVAIFRVILLFISPQCPCYCENVQNNNKVMHTKGVTIRVTDPDKARHHLDRAPIDRHVLTLIPAWISYYTHYKVSGEITYPLQISTLQPLDLGNG